jgi:hypothetical protein
MLCRIPVTFIEDPVSQNAHAFLLAISTYLCKNGSIYIPQPFNRFNLFKHITIASNLDVVASLHACLL